MDACHAEMGCARTMNREDEHLWLRYLDYYVKLHELNDAQMMRIFKLLMS